MKTSVTSLADNLTAPLDLNISQILCVFTFSFENLILGTIHISGETLV